jgi:hypothetical protein
MLMDTATNYCFFSSGLGNSFNLQMNIPELPPNFYLYIFDCLGLFTFLECFKMFDSPDYHLFG